MLTGGMFQVLPGGMGWQEQPVKSEGQAVQTLQAVVRTLAYQQHRSPARASGQEDDGHLGHD